ncbi:MAG: alanine dehydrogenase [Bacteroidales bacterium]|nr:alanine dehydrogenase [Bacteroidales bacterium]
MNSFSNFGFGSETAFIPQEEMLEVQKHQKKLTIGIPRESDKYENRICLTPEAVEILTLQGHQIILENGAGNRADYNDLQYSEKGARIVKSPKEVYQSEIILKVAPPTEIEIEMMNAQQLLFSSLHLTTQTTERIQSMIKKRINAVAFEYLRGEANHYPVVRAMSEISGSSSILIAAEYMNTENKGKGILLGGTTGVTPSEVVIIGASTAGFYAARTAIGLGATVKIFDDSIYRLQNAQYFIGQNVYTSVIHPQVIERALLSADVVIGALPYEDSSSYVVSEDIVRKMKDGAVIVDISIDSSPCFETSIITNHGNPIFRKHDVIHYCVPNIPSRVSKTASIALSNVFVPLLKKISESGGVDQLIQQDYGLRNGIVIYKGILTNQKIGRTFGLPSQNINLLIASL